MKEPDHLDRFLQPFVQPERMLAFDEIVREQRGIREWQGQSVDELARLADTEDRQHDIERALGALDAIAESQQLPSTLFPERLIPALVETDREALAYWMGRFKVSDEELTTVTLQEFRHWAEQMGQDSNYSWEAVRRLARTPLGWLTRLNHKIAQRWQHNLAAAELHARRIDRVVLDLQPFTWLSRSGPRTGLVLAERRFQVPLIIVARALDQIQPDEKKLNLELDHRHVAVADLALRGPLIRLISRIDGLESEGTGDICRNHLRYRPTDRAVRLPLEDHRDPEIYGALLWAIAQEGIELRLPRSAT